MLLAPITRPRPLANNRNQPVRWKAHQVSAAAAWTANRILMASASVSTMKGAQAMAKMKKVVAPPLCLAKATPSRTMAAMCNRACFRLTQKRPKYRTRKAAVANKVKHHTSARAWLSMGSMKKKPKYRTEYSAQVYSLFLGRSLISSSRPHHDSPSQPGSDSFEHLHYYRPSLISS